MRAAHIQTKYLVWRIVGLRVRGAFGAAFGWVPVAS